MTDRIHALTVLLDAPIREDDLPPLIAAIRQLRGVADVQTHVTDPTVAWARTAARQELAAKLWAVLYPEAQS